MTWDQCRSCELVGDEDYVGVMSLDECKQKCIAKEGCAAIQYGKNNAAEECHLKHGTDWGRTKNNNFDVYEMESGIYY